MINGFYIIAVIFVICLIAASIEDIREGEISEELLAIMSVAPILWLMNEATGEDLRLHLVIGTGLFAILLADAVWGNLGGADAITGAGIGFLLGTDGIYVMILAFILTLPYLFSREEEEEYPFIPYIFLAFLTVILFNTIKVVC